MSYSVSELNKIAKDLLEVNFLDIELSGEISNFTCNSKSLHWYFTLKDEFSSISCVMFRFYNMKIKFKPEIGLKIRLSGKLSLYTPTGGFQFIASSMKLEGEGDLELAFNKLKNELEAKGYFDKNLKKPIPKFPTKVAIITSITSAAYQDILNTASKRFCTATLFIYDSLMQGDIKSVINSLKRADKKNYDVIIIARGGGSKEDLFIFNSKELADEIFLAKTPIISAIGHESDFSISDFVADARAITPTDSMVLLFREKELMYQYLDNINLEKKMRNKILKMDEKISYLLAKLKSFGILKNLELKGFVLKNLNEKLNSIFLNKISNFNKKIDILDIKLSNRIKFLQSLKFFVQVKRNDKLVDISKLKKDDEVVLISLNSKKKAVIKD